MRLPMAARTVSITSKLLIYAALCVVGAAAVHGGHGAVNTPGARSLAVVAAASDGPVTETDGAFQLEVAVVAVATAFVAGMLIGSMGVGGVILVPVLISKPFVDVKVGVASSMLSYVLAGAVGFSLYKRNGLVPWSETLWVCAGAAPGAFLGSLVLRGAGGTTIKVLLLSLMFGSSLLSLWGFRPQRCRRRGKEADSLGAHDATIMPVVVGAGPQQASSTVAVASSAVGGDGTPDVRVSYGSGDATLDGHLDGDVGGDSELAAQMRAFHKAAAAKSFVAASVTVGLVDGLGSSLTGTSGPVVLIPLLLLTGAASRALQWPIKAALGTAQAVQVPIALAASAGNLVFSGDAVNFWVAGVLALGLCLGVPLGVRFTRAASQRTLKLMVLAALLLSSAGLAVKLAVDEQA